MVAVTSCSAAPKWPKNINHFPINPMSEQRDKVLSYFVLQMPASPIYPVSVADFIRHNNMDQGGNVMRINLEFHIQHQRPHCHVHILVLLP